MEKIFITKIEMGNKKQRKEKEIRVLKLKCFAQFLFIQIF